MCGQLLLIITTIVMAGWSVSANITDTANNTVNLTYNDNSGSATITTGTSTSTTAPVAAAGTAALTVKNCDGGFPCEEDQFCSQQWKRCRPCKDIAGRCKDMNDIHTNYPTCEAFCVKVKLEEADRACEAEKSVCREKIKGLHQSLNETESTLGRTKQQAEADLSQCNMEKEESKNKTNDQESVIEGLERTVADQEKVIEDRDEELTSCTDEVDSMRQHFIAAVVVAVVLGVSLIGAVATAVYLWRKMIRMQSNKGQEAQDCQALIKTDYKRPVEADRRSTNLGFNDQVVPGGARTPTFIRSPQMNT